MKNKKVYIAGAGSGDIGNLTLKVKDIIKKADVILYDNLVSDEIISLSSRDALLIDVGKISGFHKLSQDNINSLLIDYLKKYDIVLRLKGGDPFIFGRGAEEAEALIKEGIEFEIMPGLSSVVAVPQSVGIPITHRNYASSFFVITSHKKKNESLDEDDYKSIVNLKNTTLIFMMSVKNANIIAKNLIKYGKDANTNVAIISNGTVANSKKYEYTLMQLSKLENTDKFEMPGMIVVGDVVSLSNKLNIYNKCLSNKRIIINVPKEKQSNLEEKLYSLGAEVLNVSTNYLEKKYNKKEILDEFLNNHKFKYICFTSTYSVYTFFEILKDENIDIRNLYNYKICAVGQSTKKALKEFNLIADIIPDEYNANSLAKKLIEINANNVLCILPHYIKSELYTMLLANNIKCKRFDIYTKTIDKVRVYNELDNDIYVFTSSSSVEGLVRSYEKYHFKGKLAFCIGEKTKETAKNNGFNVIISEISTVDNLIKTILEYYK